MNVRSYYCEATGRTDGKAILDRKHPRLCIFIQIFNCTSAERRFNESQLEITKGHILRKRFKVTSNLTTFL